MEQQNGIRMVFFTKEGVRHREGGQPAIEWFNGYKEWYYEGKNLEVSFNEEALRMIKIKAFW